MDRKKALKDEYKKLKPDMGVYKISFKNSDKVYLGLSEDLKGTINSVNFQLKLGSFRNRNLQNDYKNFGFENMTIEIIEELEHKEDDKDIDYVKDLETLRDMISENYDDIEYIKYRRSK